ncbi:MAG: hypothetical protein JNL08_10485 [Planctomycetes bacterium]|nr:hypothetical protein [Planctomycetota bacterium]
MLCVNDRARMPELEPRLPEITEACLLAVAGSVIVWTGFRMVTRGWREANDRTWVLGRPVWIPFYGVVAGVICIVSMFRHRGFGSFGISWLGLQLGLLAAFLRVILKGRPIIGRNTWSPLRKHVAQSINVLWGGVPDGLMPLSYASHWRWSTVLLAAFGSSLLLHTIVADVSEETRLTWIVQNSSVILFAACAWIAIEATLANSRLGMRWASIACWLVAGVGVTSSFLDLS